MKGIAPRPSALHPLPEPASSRRRHACTTVRLPSVSSILAIDPLHPHKMPAILLLRPTSGRQVGLEAHSLESSSISSFFWHPVWGQAMLSCNTVTDISTGRSGTTATPGFQLVIVQIRRRAPSRLEFRSPSCWLRHSASRCQVKQRRAERVRGKEGGSLAMGCFAACNVTARVTA